MFYFRHRMHLGFESFLKILQILLSLLDMLIPDRLRKGALIPIDVFPKQVDVVDTLPLRGVLLGETSFHLVEPDIGFDRKVAAKGFDETLLQQATAHVARALTAFGRVDVGFLKGFHEAIDHVGLVVVDRLRQSNHHPSPMRG